MRISEHFLDETVAVRSRIRTDVWINVWKDGSGGYYSYVNKPFFAVALAEITKDVHERLVMNKEYDTVMRRRKIL